LCCVDGDMCLPCSASYQGEFACWVGDFEQPTGTRARMVLGPGLMRATLTEEQNGQATLVEGLLALWPSSP
jgi:hypothetical protein